MGKLQGRNPIANPLTGGVDEVFLRTDSGGTANFLADALGSTLALADSSGTIQTQYTYEPFGKTAMTGAASGNGNAFTGRVAQATIVGVPHPSWFCLGGAFVVRSQRSLRDRCMLPSCLGD